MPSHGGNDSKEVTGVSDVTYDVMALLTNKLEGLEAMEMYKDDADSAGDQELSQLIERLQQQDRESVKQLKSMLAARLK